MKSNKPFLVVITLVYIAVLTIVFVSKANPYLWFDEAGQFWMSKGLHHYADPLLQEKGVIDVLENNAYYNMDPGGFSLLLHFWSKIANSHIWLRLLPFLFLILAVGAFIYLFFKWTKNIFIASLAGFIPLFIPLLLDLGLELRAYSMEVAGTVIAVIAMETLKNRISYKRLFIWGLVFAFFITSRYAEIIVVFVCSLAILYLVLNSGLSLKQKITAILVYSLPLVITLSSIYYFSLSVQNPAVNPIYYLPYLSADTAILLRPAHLVYLFALLVILILLLFSNRYPLLKRYQLLLFSAFTINALFIILSFAGMHPWHPYSARCISLFLITLLCITAFVAEILLPFFKGNGNMKYYIALPMLLVLLYVRKNSFTNQQKANNSYTAFKKIGTKSYHRIYVNAWESPSVRYLFEYGALKGHAQNFYPEKFTFGKSRRHNISADYEQYLHSFNTAPPKMSDYLIYDLIIGPPFNNRGNYGIWTPVDGTLYFYEKKDSVVTSVQ